MKRQPYFVTVRRMATGADYSGVIFLHTAADAFGRFAHKVRVGYGIPATALRLVSCNAATAEQVAAHRARLAAL
jgi:hypothetical protein